LNQTINKGILSIGEFKKRDLCYNPNLTLDREDF